MWRRAPLILGMCGLILTWGCRNRPDRTQHRPEPAHGTAESRAPTSDRGAGQQTTAVPEEPERVAERPSSGPGGGAPARGPRDHQAEGAETTGASASDPPSEADIKACMEAARRFSPHRDLVKDLRVGDVSEYSHKPRLLIRGTSSLFFVGVDDHRVYSFYRRDYDRVPKLGQPLSVQQCTERARAFLQERGLAITPEMKLIKREMVSAATMVSGGTIEGSVLVEWQAYRGDVKLPKSYELRVDSATGVVREFAMRDDEVTVDLTPKLSAEQIRRIALQQAPRAGKDPIIADQGLTVWIDRDGTQRLCRVVDLTHPGNPESITRTIVDANTGEIVMSASSGG